MKQWRVTIQYSPVQRKVIKVTGPATVELAEAAALTSMKWKAEDCISIDTEPYEPDEVDPPTVIDVPGPKPSFKPSIDAMEDSLPPPKPTKQRRTAQRKKATKK